jgi:PBP1b-binding outer membrane lipoprotein LpoB
MKIYSFILFTLTLISMVGCEQKNATPVEVPQIQPAAQAPEVKTNKVAEPEPEPQRTIEKEVSAPKTETLEKKPEPVVKETTEQSLAEVVKHGREITKSQESKTRTRAQLAEEEMKKDLENFK